MNCVAEGRSAVLACSNIVPDTSSTTRTQTEWPLGGTVIRKVSTTLREIESLSYVGERRPADAVGCDKMPEGASACVIEWPLARVRAIRPTGARCMAARA